MGRFVKGDVVVVPFPFSDLSGSKRRPALVLAELNGDDLILCQITSQYTKDSYAIELTGKDVVDGGLKAPSNIRPNKIFTTDESIIVYKICRLTDDKMTEVTQKVVDILRK